MKSSTRTGLYKRLCETDCRKVGRASVMIVGSLLGLFAVLGIAGVRINTTPSLPVGIYIAAGPQSSLIEFCPSGDAAAISARRGYRERGGCFDGASALLKPIVAKAGDVVDVTAQGIAVNNHLIQNTAPLAADTERRPLQHFPFGRYVVGDGDVWVASSYSKRSFDSRYFGPISKSAIRAHLRPLVTL